MTTRRHSEEPQATWESRRRECSLPHKRDSHIGRDVLLRMTEWKQSRTDFSLTLEMTTRRHSEEQTKTATWESLLNCHSEEPQATWESRCHERSLPQQKRFSRRTCRPPQNDRMEIIVHRFLTAHRMTHVRHSEEQRSCDVGVSQAGALFTATKEILTSDVTSSSE